jgi:hypothetical protein
MAHGVVDQALDFDGRLADALLATAQQGANALNQRTR